MMESNKTTQGDYWSLVSTQSSTVKKGIEFKEVIGKDKEAFASCKYCMSNCLVQFS